MSQIAAISINPRLYFFANFIKFTHHFVILFLHKQTNKQTKKANEKRTNEQK